MDKKKIKRQKIQSYYYYCPIIIKWQACTATWQACTEDRGLVGHLTKHPPTEMLSLFKLARGRLC